VPVRVPRCCRVCGIDHIEPGTMIGVEPLRWIDNDLCSRCDDAEREATERDAARYRHLRNRQTRITDIGAGGVFAGQVPDNVILGGEHLDRAIDAEMGLEVPAVAPLEERLAECLAACIDTPLQTLDDDGGHTITIRLRHYLPAFSNQAAELLEEAGR
jgi:hypothetical protein